MKRATYAFLETRQENTFKALVRDLRRVKAGIVKIEKIKEKYKGVPIRVFKLAGEWILTGEKETSNV